jgi:hypothetical protein
MVSRKGESEMKIEKMNKKLGKVERSLALESWYRIAEDDDSTVAYVPDFATAERIVYLLS